MRTPKQIFDEELNGEPLTEEAVVEALKICWNEAIEISKLKAKYDFGETIVCTPTDNATYYSRSEKFMDFIMNYEESISKLKIK